MVDASEKRPENASDAATPMDTEEAAPPKSVAEVVADQLTANVALIEKSVKAKETRMGAGKLLRSTAGIRRRLTSSILQDFIRAQLPDDSPLRHTLLAALDKVLMHVQSTHWQSSGVSHLCTGLGRIGCCRKSTCGTAQRPCWLLNKRTDFFEC